MATERNPFDKIEETISNVIELPEQIDAITDSPTIQPDEDGGVTVDFTETNIEMEAEADIQEWYGNLANDIDEEELEEFYAELEETGWIVLNRYDPKIPPMKIGQLEHYY